MNILTLLIKTILKVPVYEPPLNLVSWNELIEQIEFQKKVDEQIRKIHGSY